MSRVLVPNHVALCSLSRRSSSTVRLLAKSRLCICRLRSLPRNAPYFAATNVAGTAARELDGVISENWMSYEKY